MSVHRHKVKIDTKAGYGSVTIDGQEIACTNIEIKAKAGDLVEIIFTILTDRLSVETGERS